MVTLWIILSIVGAQSAASTSVASEERAFDFLTTQDAVVVGKCRLHCVNYFLPAVVVDLDGACQSHAECNSCWDLCGRLQEDFPEWGQLCVPTHEEICFDGCLQACLFHLDQDVSTRYAAVPSFEGHPFPSKPRLSGFELTWLPFQEIEASREENSTATTNRKIYAVLLSPGGNSRRWIRPQHTFSSTLTLDAESMRGWNRCRALIMTVTADGVISVANAEFDIVDTSPSFDLRDEDQQGQSSSWAGESRARKSRSLDPSSTAGGSSSTVGELITPNGATLRGALDDGANNNDTAGVELSARDIVERLSVALDSVFVAALSSGSKRENRRSHQLNVSSSNISPRGVESAPPASPAGTDGNDDLLFHHATRPLNWSATRQWVEVESIHERAVLLDLSHPRLRQTIRSCSVPGRLGNRLLVCYSDSTFWVWRLYDSFSEEKELLAAKIAEEHVSGKIITMSAFVTWGLSGMQYQHLVVITDHPPQRNLVTWHRFPIDEDSYEHYELTMEKKFWHRSSLVHLQTVQSNDGEEIFFFPTVTVASHYRNPKQAVFWIAKVNKFGITTGFVTKPLKIPSVDNYRFIKTFETAAVFSSNEVLLIVLSELVENRRTHRVSNVITVWKYDRRSGLATKLQTLLKLRRDQAKNIVFIPSQHDFFFAVLLDSGLLIYEWNRADETLNLKQTIGTSGRRLLPLDLLTVKDGAAVAVLPSSTDEASPSLFAYDSRKGIFDLQTQFACSSASAAEYGAAGIGFSCLHHEGREVEGSIGLDGSVFLVGISHKHIASVLVTGITAKLVDVPDPVVEEALLVRGRLDQLEVLGRDVFSHLEDLWFGYGASAFPAFQVEQCDLIKPHEGSLQKVDIVGEVVLRGNLTTDEPLPIEMRPIQLSAVHAVYYGIELSSLGKTLDFLQQRLYQVERLVRSGKARIVRLGPDFIEAAKGFNVRNLAVNFKDENGQAAMLDVSDLLLQSGEDELEVHGKKEFMEPFEVQYAEGKTINHNSVDTFASRNARKLIFKNEVVLDSLNVSGHALVGDGYSFGSFDISENAVPLYKSILVNDLIPGTWVFKNALIKSLEGEHQLVDGVILDRFVRAVVQRDDPDHNTTNPKVITRRINFRPGGKMSISPAGKFDFGPDATVNRLSLSRYFSAPVWLTGQQNKAKFKRLVVFGNVEVPQLTFSSPAINAQRYQHPLEISATSGTLKSVRGTIIAEQVSAASIEGLCPRIPQGIIPFNGDQHLKVDGRKIFKDGVSVGGKLMVNGKINGHRFRSILQSLKRKNLKSAVDFVVEHVNVAAGANVSITKSLRMGDLNGLWAEELRQTLISKSTKRAKFTAPVTIRHLDAHSVRITMGPFPRNVMTPSATQIVSSRAQFSSSLTLDDVKTVAISGFRMWDKRRLKLHGDYTFMRSVKLENMNVSRLDVHAEDFRRRMGIKDENGTTSYEKLVNVDLLTITDGHLDAKQAEDSSNVSFPEFAERRVKLSDVDVQKLMGDLKLTTELEARHMKFMKVDGHEAAELERFAANVSRKNLMKRRLGKVVAKNVVTAHGINGFRLSDFEHEAVHLDRENTFESTVVFDQPIFLEHLEARQVSGIDLRRAVNSLVLANDEQDVYVFGRKRFAGNVEFDDSQGVGLSVGGSINSHDPSSLLTTQTTEFRGPFTAPRSIVIRQNMQVTPRAFGMEEWPVTRFREALELGSLKCGFMEGRRLDEVLKHAIRLNETADVNATWRMSSPKAEVRINSARGLKTDSFNGIPIRPVLDRAAFLQDLHSARNGSILTIPRTVALPNISVGTMEVAGLLGILNKTSVASHALEARTAWREASFHGNVHAQSLNVVHLHGPDGTAVRAAPICGNGPIEIQDALRFDKAHVSRSMRIPKAVNGIDDLGILSANLVLDNSTHHQVVRGGKVASSVAVDLDTSLEELIHLTDDRCLSFISESMLARSFRSFQKTSSHCSQTIRQKGCGKFRLLPAAQLSLKGLVTFADFVQIGDVVTAIICQKSLNHSCLSIDLALPALRGWSESPLFVDTDYFPHQYLPIEGIVKDVQVFSTEDSSNTVYCTIITSSWSPKNFDDCNNGSCSRLELWRRVSSAGTWDRVLRITEPSPAVAMRRVKIGWRHGFDFPHLFAETTNGELLVIQIERLSVKDYVHRVVNTILIGGDFDVLDGIVGTIVAFRDPAGAIRMEPAFEEAGPVVLSCASSADVKVKFLKRNDVELLAVMESSDEEVPDVDGVGKIKIFKMDGLKTPTPFQTLPSSHVVDSEAVPISFCSSTCLVTVEEYVGMRVLCSKGAGGFQEETTLYAPHLRRITHESRKQSTNCAQLELLLMIEAGAVKFLAMVLDE